jgi:hypothetical protein
MLVGYRLLNSLSDCEQSKYIGVSFHEIYSLTLTYLPFINLLINKTNELFTYVLYYNV